ncbi:uncharacterized protein LOC143198315 [Rhynchophorus ferrugineus]|uniref:uncharacterized protein LOC143198315 n=1 Tax=Rhynchophorus ferrugineus TaxID=354439 RepID=UPI003FCDFB2B
MKWWKSIVFIHIFLLPLVLSRLFSVNETECRISGSIPLYRKFFDKVQVLAITKLVYDHEEEHPSNNVAVIVNSLYRLGLSRFKTTIVNTVTLNEGNEEARLTATKARNVIEVKVSRNLSKEGPKRSALYNKISFESYLVKIIIGRDSQTFYRYISTRNIYDMSKYARNLHVLFFSSQETNIKLIEEILVLFWDKFKIINVVAQVPCSDTFKDIFVIYKPFKRTPRGYGQVQIHHLSNLLNYPTLILNHVARLSGYPLKVSVFEDKPSSVGLKNVPDVLKYSKIYYKIANTTGMYGINGVTLWQLSNIMRFTIKLSTEEDAQFFGYVTPNKTVVGSLGMIVNRTMDFQANLRFMIGYKTDMFEYTIPYMSDKVCLLAKKASLIPAGLRVLKIFEPTLMLLVLLLLLVLSLLNKLFKIFYGLPNNNFIMEMFSISILQSNNSVLYPPNVLSFRLFLASVMIFFIIHGTAFNAGLFSAFSTPFSWPDINTLDEADKTGLMIRTIFNPFDSMDSDLYKRLERKIILDTDADKGLLWASKGSVLSLLKKMDAEYTVKVRFRNDDGSPGLHIIPECPNSYSLAYIVPIGSPYLKAFNHLLNKFIEYGFVNKWYNNSNVDLQEIIYSVANKKETISSERLANIQSLRSVFWILIIGILWLLYYFY